MLELEVDVLELEVVGLKGHPETETLALAAVGRILSLGCRRLRQTVVAGRRTSPQCGRLEVAGRRTSPGCGRLE